MVYSNNHVLFSLEGHRSAGLALLQAESWGLGSRVQLGFVSGPHVSIWNPGWRGSDYLGRALFYTITKIQEAKPNLTCTFKASACITPTPISLTKANCMAKPQISEVGTYGSSPGGEGREWIFAEQEFSFLFIRCDTIKLKLLSDYTPSKCVELWQVTDISA